MQAVGNRVPEAAFPATLHVAIVATLGLDLQARDGLFGRRSVERDFATIERRRRDPGFRDRGVRADECRCCVCGIDWRIGQLPAGLAATHKLWHHVGGPDIEPNGLTVCALHKKLFDLGMFAVEPAAHRIVSGGRRTSSRARRDAPIRQLLSFLGVSPQRRDIAAPAAAVVEAGGDRAQAA